MEKISKKDLKKLIDEEKDTFIVATKKGCAFAGSTFNIEIVASMTLDKFIKKYYKDDIKQIETILEPFFLARLLEKNKKLNSLTDLIGVIGDMTKDDFIEKYNKMNNLTEEYLKNVEEIINGEK